MANEDWTRALAVGLTAAGVVVTASVAWGQSARVPSSADSVRRVVATGLPPSLLRSTRAERLRYAERPGPSTAAALRARLMRLGYREAEVPPRLGPLRLGRYFRLDSLHLVGDWPAQAIDRVVLPQQRRRLTPYGTDQASRLLIPALERLGQQGFIQAGAVIESAEYAPAGDTVGVRLRLRTTLGPRVRLDSLKLEPADTLRRLRESNRFVGALLRLRRGDVLTPTALSDIPSLLDASAYYRATGAPELQVDTLGRALVRVPLRVERANRFDAVLGVLPPRQGQNEWQFTGLIDLALVSPLGTGEVLQFKYEELPSRSRRLDARVVVPYLAATPLGLELRLNLLKQDSLFQTVRLEPALSYAFAAGVTARLSYRSLSTSLLSTAGLTRVVWPPPPSLDGRSQLVALALDYTRLDYAFNPRRGVRVVAEAALGTKTVQRTRGLDSLDIGRLLGSQPRREWSLELWGYWPTARRQTLVTAFRGYALDQAERFDNDLAFVGGARLLRGFNEQQFLVSRYALVTLEYRLLIERDGYVGAFVDWAYLERRTLRINESIRPLGYGVTLQLGTAAGVFSIAYAVGQAENQPAQAARGRIHIGFVSRF